MKHTACYHLPGLFEFYELYRLFLPLFREHREYFYDWCEIGSIYGAPMECLWGGGRLGEGEDNPREVLDLMKTYHISARLTFSNSMLEEEHLLDPKCNTLCRLFNEAGNNGVIVHSDLLLHYLMEKYPNLEMIAGMNEYSSVGAARAVKAAKAENRIRVVGVDSSQEAVQLMEHGIFQGIVVQKAFKMGYVGVRETVKMLRGEDYKKNINSGCQLVTPDNMYTSEIEKLLFPFNTLKTYGDLTP